MNNMQYAIGAVIKQDIVDFSNMDRKGTVELKPITDDKFKKPNISFTNFKDPETGITYGIPTGTNQDGSYKFRRIIIDGHKFYNLESKNDAEEWHVVKNYHRIRGSKLDHGKAIFEVMDREKEANTYIDKYNKSIKAGQFVSNLSGNSLIAFGRLFGIDPMSNGENIIKQLLLEISRDNPKSIIERMEDKSGTAIHVVIKRAMAVGLIKHTLDKGYLYKDGITMGATEAGVVEYLRKDSTMLTHIDLESKELDRHFAKKEVSLDATIEEVGGELKEEVVSSTKKGKKETV